VQLWTKLTLGLAGTTWLIVGLYGAYQLRNEPADLRQAARRELLQTATALQVAAGHALRDHQVDDVREAIDAVELQDAALDIRVLDATGALVTGGRRPRRTGLESLVGRTLADLGGSRSSVVRFDEQDARPYLVGAFSIGEAAAARPGTLVVVRSLDELQRDLMSEIRTTLLSLATLLVGLVAAGWVLSVAYVRRPLQDLVRAMRTVRAGDLTAQVGFGRQDEIGAAVAEFNAMMADLADARRRLVQEAETRAAFEARLQHTDKLNTLGQLAAGLAHEIGSPLQVLNGRARALAARANLPHDLRRTAEILAAESDRITRIVQQLLTFARHANPSMTMVQLLPPVRDIVELLQHEASHRGVQLALRHAESLPMVMADAPQIQQVVMNLLTNALRATPRGGCIEVTLEITGDPADHATAPALLLTVTDTGHGVPNELLPRIFEPFFTTQTHQGGIGLGLGIVKSIVEAHGGAVSLRTRAGAGTTVTVSLPVGGAAYTEEGNDDAHAAAPRT
jgi:signal transduction histidine kinase